MAIIDVERSPARTSTRDDVITAGLAMWLMVGLFVDGWAHIDLAQLETFFTPWHGLFYSGFTATAVWIAVLVGRGPTGFPLSRWRSLRTDRGARERASRR